MLHSTPEANECLEVYKSAFTFLSEKRQIQCTCTEFDFRFQIYLFCFLSQFQNNTEKCRYKEIKQYYQFPMPKAQRAKCIGQASNSGKCIGFAENSRECIYK